MKIVLAIVGVLLTLVAIVAGIGYALPIKHRATRSITLQASADSIFAVLSNAAAFPEWRSGVKRVEMITRQDSLTSYRETGDDGAISYVIDNLTLAKRLVTRISDDKLPFGGTWTYELTQASTTPNGGATELRITEDGEVYNPVFRFVSRFVFGHHATIEKYLSDLARKFEQRAIIHE